MVMDLLEQVARSQADMWQRMHDMTLTPEFVRSAAATT